MVLFFVNVRIVRQNERLWGNSCCSSIMLASNLQLDAISERYSTGQGSGRHNERLLLLSTCRHESCIHLYLSQCPRFRSNFSLSKENVLVFQTDNFFQTSAIKRGTCIVSSSDFPPTKNSHHTLTLISQTQWLTPPQRSSPGPTRTQGRANSSPSLVSSTGSRYALNLFELQKPR